MAASGAGSSSGSVSPATTVRRNSAYRATARRSRLGKYNANGEKVMFKGRPIWIASDVQAERTRQLIDMEEHGVIEGLRIEVPCPLVVNNMTVCTYRMDAVYHVLTPAGAFERLQYEEVKGNVTPDWRIKLKLFNALHPEKVAVIMIDGTEPELADDGTRARQANGRMKPKSRVQWIKDHWAWRIPVPGDNFTR
jgi:hypothetical protein